MPVVWALLVAAILWFVTTKSKMGRNFYALGGNKEAAWFSGSSYFVNMVQGGGLWGFDGIRRTLELMTEAFLEEKDPEDLIIRKGWGCESCI